MTPIEKTVNEVLEQIKWIVRNHSDKDFQQGDCYLFHKILKTSFPEAVPFYEPVTGHVYTLLFNRLWDSKGLFMFPMESEIGLLERAEQWKSK